MVLAAGTGSCYLNAFPVGCGHSPAVVPGANYRGKTTGGGQASFHCFCFYCFHCFQGFHGFHGFHGFQTPREKVLLARAPSPPGSPPPRGRSTSFLPQGGLAVVSSPPSPYPRTTQTITPPVVLTFPSSSAPPRPPTSFSFTSPAATRLSSSPLRHSCLSRPLSVHSLSFLAL